jgi:hypothetical protein
MTKIQIRRRRTRFKTKKARIGPPSAPKLNPSYGAADKDYPAFFRRGFTLINTAFCFSHKEQTPQN